MGQRQQSPFIIMTTPNSASPSVAASAVSRNLTLKSRMKCLCIMKQRNTELLFLLCRSVYIKECGFLNVSHLTCLLIYSSISCSPLLSITAHQARGRIEPRTGHQSTHGTHFTLTRSCTFSTSFGQCKNIQDEATITYL